LAQRRTTGDNSVAGPHPKIIPLWQRNKRGERASDLGKFFWSSKDSSYAIVAKDVKNSYDETEEQHDLQPPPWPVSQTIP
jgi:hypothetical protein